MKIIISSHGTLAEGLKDTLDFIIGYESEYKTFCLDDRGVDVFKDDIHKYLINIEEDILVLCDLRGGTPFNIFMEFSIRNTDRNVKIITGVNIPILLNLEMTYKNNTLSNEYIEELISSGIVGIS